MPRALLSVSDKTGLTDFARRLANAGYELISTGGTAAALREAGLEPIEAAEVTGAPEILGGRVKTLHPRIHGGLLARIDRSDDRAELAAQGIAPIDLLCVNLYPFARARERSAPFDEMIEQIDVGGPAMIRAAAKNHRFVTLATDPGDYAAIAEAIEAGGPDDALRRRLAAAAFARTAAYDAMIADWFAGESGAARLTVTGARGPELRYGENPHQAAAVYRDEAAAGLDLAGATPVQGKALSYNNLLDADAALAAAASFEEPAAAIVKHAGPCGIAVGGDALEAYRKAAACDPTSAFGGIVALNRPLDGATASAITEIFTEVALAPDASDDARRVFAEKPNLRLLLLGDFVSPPQRSMRSIAGGFLVQETDRRRDVAFEVVTKRAPDPDELADLRFAWSAVAHVKSNAIALAASGATVGIGGGLPSRVDAARLAVEKAGGRAKGAVAASDAFFPFADGVERLAKAGVRAIVQPGGSKNDAEAIACADAAGIAMVFTGWRRFRH